MFYSISEFAEKIGVSPYTLRLWEKNGKLVPHHRTQGNQRVYSEEQIKEYFGGSSKKEVLILLSENKVINEPFEDLSKPELDAIIALAQSSK